MNSAKSLTEIRGEFFEGITAMEQILASANLDGGRSIHVAALARQTLIDAGADHLGFEGYFLFECADEATEGNGINVLGKAASIEAALRLIEIWQGR